MAELNEKLGRILPSRKMNSELGDQLRGWITSQASLRSVAILHVMHVVMLHTELCRQAA
jgi:hypothetical protein